MPAKLHQPDRPQPPTAAGPVAPSADDARRGIMHTQVSRPVAWGMIGVFLALIYGVPLSQGLTEWRKGERPYALELVAAGRFPTRAELRQFEDGLQEQALARRACQPLVQQALTVWGGFGNSTTVVGRDGWLFYRPGIDYITGPGFLEPRQLHQRAHNRRDPARAAPVAPDPRPAILAFARQCQAAGARLVLVPIPDKAQLQPAPLSRPPAAPPRNPSYAQFVAELRAAGVDVFDPLPEAIQPDQARFLAQDTHWTPQWMDEVARALADHLRPYLAPVPRPEMRLEAAQAAGGGDLVENLRLPEDQALFRPQPVALQWVLDAAGQPLRPSRAAPVLLLGDSFTNIYSAAAMGWGAGAGFAEHLAYHLGQPIDVLARNDAGAHATRAMLATRLAQGEDRLAGKKLVVWQFAARELSGGDWKLIELAAPTGARPGFLVPHAR